MKNTYLSKSSLVSRPWVWLLVLFAVFAPFITQAQTLTITPATSSGSPDTYGSVEVGTVSSPAKQYTITASGFVGNISVSFANAPSFEGSTDNVVFNTSPVLPATGGTLYVRFRPTTISTVTERIIVTGSDADFNNVSKNIFVQGTGTPGTPTIKVTPDARAFGQQQVNTPSAPMTITVDATSLGTTPVTVTAPTGFQVSYDGSAYGTTATIPTNANGSVSGAVVNVRFLPTAATSYIDIVRFTSSTATATATVSGTGILPSPTLTVSPTNLDFGTTTVGVATASQPFTVSGSELQGNVTIGAPSGFQIRTGSGFFSSSPITLTPTNGTLASTTIDVRFVPGGARSYDDNVTVSTPNNSATTTRNVRVTGIANPSSGTASILVNPGALDFGIITSSGSASNRTFEVSGTDLSSNIVLTPSSPNIEIRNASLNGTFSTAPLTVSRTGSTVSPQTIEVRLVSRIAQGEFNQRIDLTTQGATAQVSITGNNTSGTTSDISVSNPDASSFTFATRPNTVSVAQSFLLAGTNLVQPLVVEPSGPNSQYFEISESATGTYVRRLSFTPDGDRNVEQRRIYVRFVPGNEPLTVTSTIRNSSAPAPNFDVSVTGISEPTIRLKAPIGNFPNNVVKGTASDPRAVTVEGFLLTGDVDLRFPPDISDAERNPLQTPLFELSRNNGGTYTKTATISPDAEGNFTLPLLVRFAPVRVGNAAQDLQFRNQSFNGNAFFALNSGFGRTTGFSIAVEPTAQSTARVVRAARSTSATISFDLTSPPASRTYGQNRLVIASSTYLDKLPATLFPQDKQNFNPGTTNNGAYEFGTGTAIESSSNTFVVFSGSSQNLTVTNLDPNLEYKFFGFEFNNDGVLNAENYLTPNNEPQIPLPVALVSFSAKANGSQVALRWETASELNNKQFEVERSRDGRSFTTILTRAGQGTTSAGTIYNEVDRQPLDGLSYYRLKQVDRDGKTTYSTPVAVNLIKAGEISMYPNPVSDQLTITVGGAPMEGTVVTITDLTGRVLSTQKLRADGKLDMSTLRTGTYLVTVGEGKSKVTRRVVRN